MKKMLTGLLSALALAASCQATVLKFDGDASYHTGNGTPYQEAGYQLHNSSGDGVGVVFWGDNDNGYNADSGVPKRNTYTDRTVSTTTLSKVGGGAFDFVGLYLAEGRNDGNGGKVQFNFKYANGTQALTSVLLDHNKELEFFEFDEFNLLEVLITAVPIAVSTPGPAANRWLQMDWIVVNESVGGTTVPEPASMALVGLALAGVASTRRRGTVPAHGGIVGRVAS